MKKAISLLLVVTLVLSSVGCGRKNDSSNDNKVVQAGDSIDTSTETQTEAPTPKPTPKPTPVLKKGKTAKNKDWKIKLTDAYTSKKLQSNESVTYWEPDRGQAFLVLEMNITCKNSSKKPVDGDAVADIVATTSDGNTYSNWQYQYINSQIWCYFRNTYLDANMPIHAYIYTTIPTKQMKKKVKVKLRVAGKKYIVKVNKRK